MKSSFKSCLHLSNLLQNTRIRALKQSAIHNSRKLEADSPESCLQLCRLVAKHSNSETGRISTFHNSRTSNGTLRNRVCDTENSLQNTWNRLLQPNRIILDTYIHPNAQENTEFLAAGTSQDLEAAILTIEGNSNSSTYSPSNCNQLAAAKKFWNRVLQAESNIPAAQLSSNLYTNIDEFTCAQLTTSGPISNQRAVTCTTKIHWSTKEFSGQISTLRSSYL